MESHIPPPAPPPPLFLGKKERDLVKQVNDELIEKVVGQQILYYPIDMETTNFHELFEKPKIYFTFKKGVKVVSFINSPSVFNTFSVYFKSTDTDILEAV